MGVGKGILNANLGFVNGIFSTGIFKRVERICNSNFSYGQNYRIIGIGRDPWRDHQVWHPLLKQVSYSMLHREAFRWVWNISGEGEDNLSEQPVLGLCQPH